MECTAEGENVAEYYTITNTIPEVVTAKSSEDGSVTATLTKSSVENITETFTCTITATAMERTEIGKINNISAYYEYGLPTTLSSTDYTTLGYNVFARLGIDNSLTLCINDGELFCIKPNDYENSSLSLKTHFGEENCTIGFSNLSCSSESFYCDTYSDGFVSCRDNIANNSCYISNSGSVVCS